MKILLLVVTVLSSFVGAQTFAAESSCKAKVIAAVDKATKKLDENSEAVSAKRIGKVGHDGQDSVWGSYYVETSDESGSCTWHVLVNDKFGCRVQDVQQIFCE